MAAGTRLLTHLKLPSDLPASSVDFKWYGPGEHFAPDEATKLSGSLKGKTNCALCTLCAGALVWGARRLENVTDSSVAYLVAEVLLLWEDDPLYYQHPGPSPGPKPSGPAYEAVVDMFRETSTIFKDSPGAHISDPPIQAVENVFSVVSHVLGPEWREPFEQWTAQAIARLDAFAPNPHQDFSHRFDHPSQAAWEAHKAKNMGSPIPLDILNPQDEAWSTQQAKEFYRSFMAAANPTENRYLGTPERMLALGFSGKPYVPKVR